jgi:hypothetical protein
MLLPDNCHLSDWRKSTLYIKVNANFEYQQIFLRIESFRSPAYRVSLLEVIFINNLAVKAGEFNVINFAKAV